MANMFEKYAANREAERKRIEAERETAIAAIIHEWIPAHFEEVSE